MVRLFSLQFMQPAETKVLVNGGVGECGRALVCFLLVKTVIRFHAKGRILAGE